MEEKLNSRRIKEKIREANFRMNPFAKAYFDAFPIAEQDYGERGVKDQILYFFANVKCRTAKQKLVKKELMEWAQSK